MNMTGKIFSEYVVQKRQTRGSDFLVCERLACKSVHMLRVALLISV
jgi:hypothetical protein